MGAGEGWDRGYANNGVVMPEDYVVNGTCRYEASLAFGKKIHVPFFSTGALRG